MRTYKQRRDGLDNSNKRAIFNLKNPYFLRGCWSSVWLEAAGDEAQ